jgi:uncharacterized membrane protein
MQARTSSDDPRSLSVGTAEHFGWLQGMVKAVLVLNLLDALFTLVWVRSGLAREANPLIDQLVEEQAVGFVIVKLGLVGLGSWLLWHRRERPAAVIAIVAAFLAYYLILLYHIQYASGLVRQLLGIG